MKRRWFIRSCFMLPILLCVGGWGWSFIYAVELTHAGQPQIDVIINGGTLYLMCWTRRGPSVPEWRCQQLSYSPTRGYVTDDPRHPHLLGFSMDRGGEDWSRERYQFVVVPFYFPTAISVLALLLVCWKTRPSLKKRAFPVELAEPTEEQVSKVV